MSKSKTHIQPRINVELIIKYCCNVDGKGTPCPAFIDQGTAIPRCKNGVAISAALDSTVWTTDEIQVRMEQMGSNCERIKG